MKLRNYTLGKWYTGKGQGQELYNAINGDVVAVASADGLDFGEILDYGRTVGNPALRRLTFHERGKMLKNLALRLSSLKDEFYKISWATGATRADAWIDIEGGIGNLFAYASLRRELPNECFFVDGQSSSLAKDGSFIGHHIMTPKKGVAIHINAFNFPVWGMLEKIAVNLLAGMPAVVKPATVTSFLTEAVFREIIKSRILPEGSLQLICGSGQGLIDHVESQDVVTFTGSASTGMKLKSHPRIIGEAVPFNLEADSLNCSVLGEDAKPGTEEFEIFIKEVHREMTVKAGQKCTAIRRIIVPVKYIEDVQIAIGARLNKTIIGDPQVEGVRMGSLAGKVQLQEVRTKIEELLNYSEIVYGDPYKVKVVGADQRKGAFISPVLLLNKNPFRKKGSHEIEAFGPVSTIIPYKNSNEAIELANLGKGSLVCSIATFNDDIAREFVLGAGSHHGRILILNRENAKSSTGHGSPMPMLVHGGPGRAGGGEEMGGKRGIYHYMQRTAIQGSPTSISRVIKVYQLGAKQIEKEIHVFRKHFEELEIGETVVTHKHTVTEADIVNFANVSGDNFYAHMDATSLDGTIFERRVAHGYFLLSKAAGLFVDPKKGPVLLNYGIEECRFTKPVYPGTTIGVRLTVKEKTDQEKKTADDISKGIVKFLVEILDEKSELVGIATILTMVRKKNQD